LFLGSVESLLSQAFQKNRDQEALEKPKALTTLRQIEIFWVNLRIPRLFLVSHTWPEVVRWSVFPSEALDIQAPGKKI